VDTGVSEPLPAHLQPDARGFGRGYFEAAENGKLALPVCTACRLPSWPPRKRCPACGAAMDWATASGRGAVHTFTIVRQNPEPYFAERVPYAVAMIDLDEGPRVMGNVIGCDVEALRVGMRVVVTFVDAGQGLMLPMFAPAAPA
jgi:uncharacterized OB-fold protein